MSLGDDCVWELCASGHAFWVWSERKRGLSSGDCAGFKPVGLLEVGL